MSEEEKHLDHQSLTDYKSKVAEDMKLRLDWQKDLIFEARTNRGYVIEFDAKVEWGCMPTESLLASIAGCMAIDVVSFLQKMRVEITSFTIESTAKRNPTPPQYFKAVELLIKIKGKGLDDKKVQRAVSLSKEKYCSVYHTLRPDMEHTVRVEFVNEP